MEPAVGVVVGGRYQLRRPLGEGGMASVWAAYDREQKEVVAIKFMRTEYAAKTEARLRFQREALAPMQIKNNHVVSIRDHGMDGDTLFIVMEMLIGEDLLKRLQREGRMSVFAAGKLLNQIAEGLHAAHKLGIVHRDLKPGNIVLARSGSDEAAKIVDFGIAKAKHASFEEEATRTGAILGTIQYTSPEQLKSSRDVDHRSDLWSLAVILLRLITGKMPFGGGDYPEMVRKICSGPVPVPSMLAPELTLPQDLDGFFMRALNRDCTERFQTAVDMAEHFNKLLIGTPVEPPSSTKPLTGQKQSPQDRIEFLDKITKAGLALSTSLEQRESVRSVNSAVKADAPTMADAAAGEVSATQAAEVSDSQVVEVVNSAEPSVDEPTVKSTASAPVLEAKATDDEASTHLKIDVDLDSALIKAEANPVLAQEVKEKRAEKDSGNGVGVEPTKVTGQPAKGVAEPRGAGGDRATDGGGPERERSVVPAVVGVVVVIVAIAGALGAWRYVSHEGGPNAPSAPGSPGR